jgi:hypothetical protein
MVNELSVRTVHQDMRFGLTGDMGRFFELYHLSEIIFGSDLSNVFTCHISALRDLEEKKYVSDHAYRTRIYDAPQVLKAIVGEVAVEEQVFSIPLNVGTRLVPPESLPDLITDDVVCDMLVTMLEFAKYVTNTEIKHFDSGARKIYSLDFEALAKDNPQRLTLNDDDWF